MRFDETQYAQEFIKKLRGARSLPDDLLARYAITLPAGDADIAAQIEAVRAYWTKIYQGKSHAAQVASMCRAEDDRLRAEHGASMKKSQWWETRQSERRSAAQASITVLAEELQRAYGKLGVVTAGIVDSYAARLELSRADALLAVEQARLSMVDGTAVPQSEPMPSFATLLKNMSECGVSSVPELVHPGSGPFSLIDRYSSAGDPGRRLDVVAVVAQITQADTRGASATEDARRGALKILQRAARDGVDLGEIALYHLVTVAREFVPPSAGMAAAELQKIGLDGKDAAVIAVVLADQSSARGEAGLAKVRKLLTSGRLKEASQLALSLPREPGYHADAIKAVEAARESLATLLAAARSALEVPDEVRAAALLRDAARISIDDAGEALAAVPEGPPADLRAICEGNTVRLFWQPAPGHDASTTYVVTRTERRPPAAVADGTPIHRGRANDCTDGHAPVARAVLYGVFALGDGRPNSRPAVVTVTLVPPVSHLEADVSPTEVALHWSAPPAAQEVRVTRTMPGGARDPVTVTANGCQVRGLTEGQTQHFEVAAIYRGLDGAELRSPVQQINATPRSEAQPLPKLRVRPIEVAGAVRIRVAWAAIDNSEIRVLRSGSPPSWQFGTWVSPEEMAQFGPEVTGRRGPERGEIALEAEMPPGVHHLVPFSIGGTGIVVGRSAKVGVIDPVQRLAVTSFSTYATLSWEWPPTVQLAEVTWELDGNADAVVIGLGEYRSQGGARVPLGRGPCRVEVRAVIMADGTSFTSPPVLAVIDKVVDTAIGYTVSRAAGPFGGRSRSAVFTSAEGCDGVRVKLVAMPGRVMPTSADGGFVLLDTALTLAPGVPVKHDITIPRQVKRPYWVRCFVAGGRARLIDPPIASMKET
jgi:hypothetical protein